MGGTPKRMEQFAYRLMEEISYKIPTGTTLQDISRYSYRYSMYKVGPVLCISVSIKTCISSFIYLFIKNNAPKSKSTINCLKYRKY